MQSTQIELPSIYTVRFFFLIRSTFLIWYAFNSMATFHNIYGTESSKQMNKRLSEQEKKSDAHPFKCAQHILNSIIDEMNLINMIMQSEIIWCHTSYCRANKHIHTFHFQHFIFFFCLTIYEKRSRRRQGIHILWSKKFSKVKVKLSNKIVLLQLQPTSQVFIAIFFLSSEFIFMVKWAALRKTVEWQNF